LTQSALFFCGQPLVAQPISQRIATFGAYLAARGWDVHLTAVDPEFDGTPFTRTDPISGKEVEIVGPTHYRVAADGTRVTKSPVDSLRDCRAIARRLQARAADMTADRIVISTTLPASLYALGALRRSRPSLWLDVDDWNAAHYVAGGGGRVLGATYDAVERVVPRLARHVTACSADIAGVFPKAAVIPNFIRLSDVPERPCTADVAGTSNKGSRTRVTFPGTVTKYYGHVPLLETLARRRADCGDIDFVVIGDGDALEECRQLVATTAMGDVVRFTGQLSRAEMLDELVHSDVSVLPLRDIRLDRSRFPLKMLDALACGSALAASDTGMARETLTDGESALLSPAGDMDKLLDDVLELAAKPDLRARLSKAGLELVRDYDEDVVCGRWMALLN
jgi:glycosyltransferase involved in cell wall biosynthesis